MKAVTLLFLGAALLLPGCATHTLAELEAVPRDTPHGPADASEDVRAAQHDRRPDAHRIMGSPYPSAEVQPGQRASSPGTS